MNKQKFFTTSLIAISAFLLGAGINNVAHSEAAKTVNPQGIKIGVVDVNQVVSSSQQVKALKAQQDAKKKELVKIKYAKKINTIIAPPARDSHFFQSIFVFKDICRSITINLSCFL